MEYVLTTQGLCKHYGRFKALDTLSMHVPKGSIYGFVGRNGAGKTTLIRLICGLQQPSSGSYTLYGAKSSNGHTLSTVRRRMGAVVETPSIYLDLSAADNLKQQYRVLGRPSDDGILELLSLVGLEDTGRKKARHFSLGMRQRLGIAVALAGEPDFLVLDEPVNGLDPQGIIETRELILKLNQERGITVLISSHILDELARLATHYGFIDRGRILREISAAEWERSCGRHTRITVSDMTALSRVLEERQIRYTVCSDHAADIYDRLNVTDLVTALACENCRVETIEEREDSLESYYVNLLGGGRHE